MKHECCPQGELIYSVYIKCQSWLDGVIAQEFQRQKQLKLYHLDDGYQKQKNI